MNQEQRKFLIAQVEKTWDHQRRKLIKPIRPSLNNYLVAAVLDNSVKYASLESLKKKVREQVLKMGPSDALIKEEARSRYRYESEDPVDTIILKAEDLFELPEGYKQSLAEYERKKAEYEKQQDHLEQVKNTIIMKIQLGSNEVLSKLITQVDNMADLNIINNQFLLLPSNMQIEDNSIKRRKGKKDE